MSKISQRLSVMSLAQVWGIFFLYSVIVSLLIQFWVLPIVLPQYHMGHGLLNGGDWTFYHSKAVELSYNINTNGWAHWEMRPGGFGILGFVSAIYSFFGVYEPYVLIPFFSVLHALGAISIVLLVEKMGVGRVVSVLSALPFLVFPSSLLWVTQILKDIFTINGSLLILLGLVGIVDIAKERDFIYSIKKQLSFSIVILFGFLLLWLVRPYFVQISLVFMLLVFFSISLFLILLLFRRKVSLTSVLVVFLVQFVLYVLVALLPPVEYEKIDNRSLMTAIPSPVMQKHCSKTEDRTDCVGVNSIIQPVQEAQSNSSIIQPVQEAQSNSSIIQPVQEAQSNSNVDLVVKNNQCCSSGKTYKDWLASPYLASRIDNEFKKLYLQRSYFYQVQSKANSTIDYGHDLNSAKKIIFYIPRAIQIALFSPFPSSWLADHPSQLSKLMHIVTGVEMLAVYICLVGLFVSIYIWRRKVEFWIIVSFSFYFALIPTYAFPNVGALIRYRYGAIMLLVALGISAFLYLYNDNNGRQNTS